MPRSKRLNLIYSKTLKQTGILSSKRFKSIRTTATAMLSWRFLIQLRSSNMLSIGNSKTGDRRMKLRDSDL